MGKASKNSWARKTLKPGKSKTDFDYKKQASLPYQGASLCQFDMSVPLGTSSILRYQFIGRPVNVVPLR